jgi:hypothetical protein
MSYAVIHQTVVCHIYGYSFLLPCCPASTPSSIAIRLRALSTFPDSHPLSAIYIFALPESCTAGPALFSQIIRISSNLPVDIPTHGNQDVSSPCMSPHELSAQHSESPIVQDRGGGGVCAAVISEANIVINSGCSSSTVSINPNAGSLIHLGLSNFNINGSNVFMMIYRNTFSTFCQ